MSNYLIDFIASFVSGHGTIAPEEIQAWAEELRQQGQAADYFFSLNRYLFVVPKLA